MYEKTKHKDPIILKKIYKKRSGSKNTKDLFFLIICSCGREVTKKSERVSYEKNFCKECDPSRISHGLSDHALYRVWRGIKDRTNPNSKSKFHVNYIKNKIKMSKAWERDFKCFYDWAISSGYKKGLTIDRIDNRKGYYPSNCRWVNYTVQANNKNNNHFVYYKKRKYTVTQFSREFNLKYWTVRRRILAGYSLDDVLKDKTLRIGVTE